MYYYIIYIERVKLIFSSLGTQGMNPKGFSDSILGIFHWLGKEQDHSIFPFHLKKQLVTMTLAYLHLD